MALITAMWANNEVGTLSPVAELGQVAAEYGIPLHTDAVQAVGVVPVDFAASGAAALSLTAHKLGGPYGTGALLLRRDVACVPLLHGGGQERDVRSGTLDAPGIVGLGHSGRAGDVEPAHASGPDQRVAGPPGAGVLERVPDAVLNGSRTHRLPGNAHFSFPDCEGDSLLMLLDAQGVECSTGSACSAGVAQPSHVLTAMGLSVAAARGSLRFSLGHTSTDADVDAVLSIIGDVLVRARAAGLANAPGPRFQRAQRQVGVEVPA